MSCFVRQEKGVEVSVRGLYPCKHHPSPTAQTAIQATGRQVCAPRPKPLSPLPADPHPEGIHLMNDQYMTQKTTQTIHNQYVCRCFSPPPAWFQHNSPCVIRPYYNALRPLSPCLCNGRYCSQCTHDVTLCHALCSR